MKQQQQLIQCITLQAHKFLCWSLANPKKWTLKCDYWRLSQVNYKEVIFYNFACRRRYMKKF